MRPTDARLSGMPGPKTYLPWWGDKSGLMKQRGIYQYTLAPNQFKANPNMIRNYLFNAYRRLSGEALFFVIPLATGYGIYAWAKSYDSWQNSKAAHAAQAHHE